MLDCPARGEIFAASPGAGACKNGGASVVRPATRTGPDRRAEADDRGDCPALSAAPIEHAPYVPSLAYRIAMVADGELDATFVKPNSHDWDLAAADLILSEAGGNVLTADGKPPVYGGANPRHGALVAGSGALLAAMVAAAAR